MIHVLVEDLLMIHVFLGEILILHGVRLLFFVGIMHFF